MTHGCKKKLTRVAIIVAKCKRNFYISNINGEIFLFRSSFVTVQNAKKVSVRKRQRKRERSMAKKAKRLDKKLKVLDEVMARLHDEIFSRKRWKVYGNACGM